MLVGVLLHTLLHIGGIISRFISRILTPLFPQLQQLQMKFADSVGRFTANGFSSAGPCSKSVITKAFQRAHSLGTLQKGDYYEFGIYKGYAIWRAQQLAQMYNLKTFKLFGFDSFEGLPDIQTPEDHGEFFPGQYACSLENVTNNILSHGGSMDNLTLIKGFFDHSLTKKLKQKYAFKPAAIIYIDSDLYSSAVTVLEYCKDLLMKDTLILFDDWNAFNANDLQGERKAFREFLQKYPHIKVTKDFSFCWHGQAFRVC